MNIFELGDFLNLPLNFTRYPNQNNRYTVSFENTETKGSKNDPLLMYVYGQGKSPEEAIRDYAERIQGKLLVINAASDNRMEFTAPKDLEV